MDDKFYKLQEIADWQLKKKSTIYLPSLQRSFVWKPYQIETLWDSILRGFPIGAFLLAKSFDGSYFLMDGQQRATSISLGFYNPWNSDANFYDKKVSSKPPTVWIDLSPQDITTTHKFLIKVLTRSHPWGYKSKNNQSILSVDQRRVALKNFKKEGSEIRYTDLNNTEVFPFDANLPIPLCFLLEYIIYSESKNDENNEEQFGQVLLNKCIQNLNFISCNENLINKYRLFIESQEFKIFVDKIKKSVNSYTIPAIVTDSEILKETDENENNSKDDPTLFVRLNSSGTTINGEELIYSIYKAEFPKSKNLVENISADYVKPSSLISVFSRIVWSEINQNIFPNTFSVNDFRKRLRENNTFEIHLIKFIGDENHSFAKQCFEKAIEILTSEVGPNLPPTFIKALINNSNDIFLILLNWITKNYFKIEKENFLGIKRKFVEISIFCINIKKLSKEIWIDSQNYDFWNDEKFVLFYKEHAEYLFQLPNPIQLKNILQEEIIEKRVGWNNFYLPTSDCYAKLFGNTLENKYSSQEKEQNHYELFWEKLLNTLVWNRNLLIFVQGDYFKENFSEYDSLEILSDTNRPWDWDHIYPQSWVYNQRNINTQVKEWYNMNGNLRAITLEENRSEGNYKSPSERFPEDRKDDFFIKNDWEFWKEINCRINSPQQEKFLMTAFVIRTSNIYAEIYKFLN